MNSLKVSIITPTYNRGHLIENTIRSVLNQSYSNIEYIVIDGQSTDNTVEILESYKNESKLDFISRNDQGMYFAINDGMKMATGDIIAYLNSDDLYFPWTVEKAVNVFMENHKIDMIYGDSMVFDINSNRKYLNIYASHKRYWLPTGGVLCQPTVFLRKHLIEGVGYFNTEYKYLADCEYWLRVNERADLTIQKIDEVMVIECNHNDTFRESFKEDITREKITLLRLFGKQYNVKKSNVTLLKMISYLQKELKLWRFIFASTLKTNKRDSLWGNFLEHFSISFNFINYILCKKHHDRSRFPRFNIMELRK